jgi:dTDP-4-dehydrorhamnose reductase
MVMAPRLLVIGHRGLMGRAACAHLADRYEIMGRGRPEIDLARPNSIAQTLSSASYEVVLNCAGFTDVDGAETAALQARAVNAEGVAALAEQCRRRHTRLVHIGTDYVFDGRQAQPYAETDTPAPLSEYGASKLMGERAVLEAAADNLVCRTSGLYGPHGPSFVGAVGDRVRAGEQVVVVRDQRTSPTSTRALCQMILALLDHGCQGLYHTVATGQCSWFTCAQVIAESLGRPDAVSPCWAREQPRAARRPRFGGLDNGKLTRDTGHVPAPWEEALRGYLQD